MTFFDNFAKQVADAIDNNTEKPVIVVVASAKVNKYDGKKLLHFS